MVVGGGISGLTAAHVFRKARPDARVLVLDNHDDFGGHAKRNEFTHNGRTYIGYGGTQSIDSPAPYSQVARDLISELGIEVSRYPKVLNSDLYKSLGLRPAFFFDKETFGTDRLLAGDLRDDAFLAAAPVSDAVRRDHKRLMTERFDPMPGLSQSEKKARLARMSYADFLTKMWKLDPGVLPLYQTRPHGLFGFGIDAAGAGRLWLRVSGFGAMGLDSTPGPGQNFDSIRSRKRRITTSISPTAMRRSHGSSCEGSTRRPRRLDDGRHRDRAGRLRQARHRRSAGENPGEQLRDARVAHRAGRPRPARRSGALPTAPDPDGQGALGRPGVLALHHSVPVSRVACRAEDGARATPSRCRSSTRTFSSDRGRPFRSWASSASRLRGCGTPRWAWISVSLGGYKCQTDPAEPIVLHLSKAACRPACRRATSTARAGPNCSRPPSKRSSEAFARSTGRTLGGGVDSIRPPTSSGSPSTAGHMATPYQHNSLADDFWLNGGEQPSWSHASVWAHRHANPTPAPTPTPTAPSITDIGRPRNCSPASWCLAHGSRARSG